MLILLEGVGRTGKTTLAERLCADLSGYQRVHFGVPDQPDALGYFQNRLRTALETFGEKLILDRFHWSNYAYGEHFGGSVLTDFDFCWLDQWLAQRPSLALLLADEPRTIYRRMMETAVQDPTKLRLDSVREIGEIQNRFYRAFDRSGISPKWSLGLDQFFDLGTQTMKPLPPYEELLGFILGGEQKG